MKKSKAKRYVEKWKSCDRCVLCNFRDKIVHYRGSAKSKLMIVGEAPGADEDKQGKPFVGLSGKLLDELLVEANAREYFITNVVACRPPSNRVPNRDELRACRPRLYDLLDIVAPDVILLVGGTAAKHLGGITAITSWRGRPIDITLNNKDYVAIATFHPSYLLRKGKDETVKKQIVSDIKKALEMLDD